MMHTEYYKKEAIEKAAKSVKYYQVRIEAWKNVKRITKKNGEDFQNLNRCFENAEIERQYNRDYITVRFRDETGHYTKDEINLEANYYTEQEAAETADQVQERINKQIAKYKEWLEKDKKGLEQIEKQLEQVNTYLYKIAEIIEQAEEETNTHYKIKDYIKGCLGIH